MTLYKVSKLVEIPQNMAYSISKFSKLCKFVQLKISILRKDGMKMLYVKYLSRIMQDHQLLESFMNEDFGCQLKNNISDKSFQKITKIFTKCPKTMMSHH